ncbi:MAG: hypothetical protein U0Q55_03180 [Vicinamibacterales bacterium]
MERAPSTSRRWLVPALLALLTLYLLAARTFDTTSSFLLLRDQMRDWRIALGPFSALPLTGPQSTAGGSSLGPVYYWVLWLSRLLLGPFTNNMPHAGAWGIALLQTGADLALILAVGRRTGTLLAGVAAVLLSSTSAHELALSETIWNPAVSVAFVKYALAARLHAGERASLWATALTTAFAWFAVQAHSASVFVAAPVVGSFVLQDVVLREGRRALERTRAIVEVIVLLQIPFLISLTTSTGEAVPTRALAGAASGSIRWQASWVATLDFTSSILAKPWPFPGWPVLLPLGMGITAFVWRRSPSVLGCTVAPMLLTVAGFALWQGGYDEYWFLPLAPCAALTLVLAVTAWQPRTMAAICIGLLAINQPARLQASRAWYRMPEYRPIVLGATRIVRQTKELRRLDTAFRMPPFSDVGFPYEILGGRFSPEAPFDAVINADGSVDFRPVR